MAYPQRITINGTMYDIPSQEEWESVHNQIENYFRTGRQLVRINYPAGSRHVLLNDSSSLDIWIEND